MMPTLRAASLRHLLRHPAQLALALIGLTLGVGTIVAVDVATASSQRAFELSLRAVNGAATHQITGGPRGIDERLYAQLRTHAAAGAPPRFAPLVTGYVTVGERTMQLVGVDPFAAVELADEGRVGAAPAPATDGVEGLRRWFTEPGAVVLSVATAQQLGLAVNNRFDVTVGGVGALCGVLLGVALGRGLVGLVSQTINDLYFVVTVNEVTVPVSGVVAALCAGPATALAAALLPALEVAASAPQLGLARSVLETRAVRVARTLAVVSALLAVGAGLIAWVSGRSLLAGFATLFMLLLSVAAVTPAALRVLAQAAARLGARLSPVARLACGDIAASLSRTGVASAALGMALTAMIGVAIMVESFRESLREWLIHTLRADVYVSAPGPAEASQRRLDPAVIRALLATPGIRDHSESRRVEVASPRGALDLNAVRLAHASYAALPFTQGDAAHAWPQFARGAILVSEPLAWRLGLAPHDTLTLTTAAGPRAFAVAGVYREYGNDRGEVLMSLGTYQRLWADEAISGLGIYLAPGVEARRAVGELRAAAGGRQALLIRSNADIRALAMGIFERTFVITRVLYWLAAGVAAVALVSALLAWELERSRELAILRSLGLTPRGTALLVLAQTTFMGVAALAAAIPAGLLTALVLTGVINRRAFGWQIDLHLTAAQFTDALWLALAAALAAGVYPAWRSARAPLVHGLRAE